MKTATIVVLLLAICPAGAIAQGQSVAPAAPAIAAPAAQPSWWDRVSTYVQLRKAFDGGKGETEAAAIGLIAPGNGSKAYFLADVAVRSTPWNWQLNDAGTFELFANPSFEWHHMNAEPLLKQDETNKVGPGLNAELWFPPIGKIRLRHALVGKSSWKRNLVKDTTERSIAVYVEPCAEGVETHEDGGWEGGFRPCAELTYDGARRLHYYPYVGFEHYQKLDITSSSVVVAPRFDGSLFLARVQADVYPFNTTIVPGEFTGLVLNVEYSYRRTLEAHEGLESRNLQMLRLGATYFFVKGQAVGVGLTLDAGRSPDVNFISQRRVVLALRLKTVG